MAKRPTSSANPKPTQQSNVASTQHLAALDRTNSTPPPALLPYQQRWVADHAPLKVAEKSRRIGLTWGEAADNALTAASADGSNIFYISATQDMALEYIEACAMWAKAYHLAAGEIEEGIFLDDEDKAIKLYKIDFPKSGHRIVSLSSRPANLRGKQGIIVIDEAAFAPDLEGLIKAAMAMLMWGDKVRILSTHNGDANPFNQLINDIRSGKRQGSVHRITFDEAVKDGLFRRVCLRKNIEWSQQKEDQWVEDVRSFYGDDAAEELDVIPAQGGGAYLPLALLEMRTAPANAVPVIRQAWDDAFSLLPETIRAQAVSGWCYETIMPNLATLAPEPAKSLGVDFARVGDLTAIVVLQEDQDLVRRVALVVEISRCPFRQQEQITAFIAKGLTRLRALAIDAGGNGAALAEHMADQFGQSRTMQIKFSDKLYLENMPRFKAHLEDGTLDHLPKDNQCRDDLRALQKINGIPKLPKQKTQRASGEKQQRHGDFAIALFLADLAMNQDNLGTCEGFISIPKKHISTDNLYHYDDDYQRSLASFCSRHLL